MSKEWREPPEGHLPAQVGQFRSPAAEGRALGTRRRWRWRGGRPPRTRPGSPLQPLSSDVRGRMERWATTVSHANYRGKSRICPQDAGLVLWILLLPSPTLLVLLGSERTTRGPVCQKSPRGPLPLSQASTFLVSPSRGVLSGYRCVLPSFLVPKWYRTVCITGYIHPQQRSLRVKAVMAAMLLTAKIFGTTWMSITRERVEWVMAASLDPGNIDVQGRVILCCGVSCQL